MAFACDGPREMLPVEMPFTGRLIGRLPACTEADVARAVSCGRDAYREWSATSARQRAEIMFRLHDLVIRQQDELMDLMQIDTGKARRDALEEVLDVANNARYYANRAVGWLAPKRRRGALPVLTRVTEHFRPYGVVALINPWNYPFTLALSDAIPAILAGNVIVLKPAEEAMLTALRAALLLEEAGLPRDVFQVVTGRGVEAGRALVQQADAICFTGSSEVGLEIARESAGRLAPFSLELGGKNPMIVLDDANLPRSVQGAMQGCFSNAGQLCIAFERLYVQDGIYDAFLPELVRRTQQLSLGAQFDFSADIGSLISQAQLDKTIEHVQDAVANGARLLTGGNARPDLGPYFFEPTILTRVDPSSRLYKEETFGPVVSIYRFNRPDEAVRLANDSAYGLNGAIWTNDVDRGADLASRLEVGSVSVNDAYAATWGSVDAPMGGMKLSGFGRRHGRQGFYRFVQSQTIAEQSGTTTAGSTFGPDADVYRQWMTTALRLMRRTPFLG